LLIVYSIVSYTYNPSVFCEPRKGKKKKQLFYWKDKRKLEGNHVKYGGKHTHVKNKEIRKVIKDSWKVH
jgi:hypothetical protein